MLCEAQLLSLHWGPDSLLSRPCSGMELFEEALQKWEQALSVGQRGDSGSTPTPGDGLRNPETASEALSEVRVPYPRPWSGLVGGWSLGGSLAALPSASQALAPLDGSMPLDKNVSPAK